MCDFTRDAGPDQPQNSNAFNGVILQEGKS